MACNFISVKSASKCTEDFSGVGSKFYIFDGSTISTTDWNLDNADTLDKFSTLIKTAVGSKSMYCVEIKPKSGKITATNNKNGGGFTNVFTGMVAKNMQRMSELARTLNNSTDWGILVPTKGGYYVLFDKDFGIEFEMSSDSGDSPDSDHGHTVTITCGPMLYAMPIVKIDSLNEAKEITTSGTTSGTAGDMSVIK